MTPLNKKKKLYVIAICHKDNKTLTLTSTPVIQVYLFIFTQGFNNEKASEVKRKLS